jgi:hypothetical protein
LKRLSHIKLPQNCALRQKARPFFWHHITANNDIKIAIRLRQKLCGNKARLVQVIEITDKSYTVSIHKALGCKAIEPINLGTGDYRK